MVDISFIGILTIKPVIIDVISNTKNGFTLNLIIDTSKIPIDITNAIKSPYPVIIIFTPLSFYFIIYQFYFSFTMIT
ncbi:hypothetical protein QQO_2886 [Clostridioides difficile P3]|nr:hypothetical protein QQO_2886 [Clostridioides difficile P3]